MRPRRQPPDPYATLGLAHGASHAEVRRAYRRRAMAIHPDVTGSDSTAEMARLNRARDELLSRPAAAVGRSPGADPDEQPHPRPARPAWAASHEAAWANHWSAWNELPRRDRDEAAAPGEGSGGSSDRDAGGG